MIKHFLLRQKVLQKDGSHPRRNALVFATEFLRQRRDDSLALLRGATLIPTLRESSNALFALAIVGEIHCSAWV